MRRFLLQTVVVVFKTMILLIVLFSLIAKGASSISTFLVTTIAGNQSALQDAGDLILNGPNIGIVVDSSIIYLSDTNRHRVLSISMGTGASEVILGNSSYGDFASDSSSAVSGLWQNGEALFVGDMGNGKIRRLNLTSGDLQAFGSRTLLFPSGIWGNNSNLFVAEREGKIDRPDHFSYFLVGHRISKIALTDELYSIVAGTGFAGYRNDYGPATSSDLNTPNGLWLDSSNSIYVADSGNNRIRVISSSGIITTLCGDGTDDNTGDGGPATAASISYPAALWGDSAGAYLYVSTGGFTVRRISLATSIITTFAGTGSMGFSGDGGAATSATLYAPMGLHGSDKGDVYILLSSGTVRVVDSRGAISTVIGYGQDGYSGDNLPASEATLNSPGGVAVDTEGDLYIADTYNFRVRRVDNSSGIIVTVAGNGYYGYRGDYGPATQAMIGYVYRVSVDTGGNLYVLSYQSSIRRVSSKYGIITTVLSSTDLRYGLSIDPFEGLLYTLYSGNVVERRRSSNRIERMGGTYFTAGYAGDTQPATDAKLHSPYGLWVDSLSNVYVADRSNYRIRKISSSGIISTIAGLGGNNYLGDGRYATAANVSNPTAITGDSNGNLYVIDNQIIQAIDVSNGRISRVAGSTTESGYNGDSIPARFATLNNPFDLCVDSSGNIYVADTDNNLVRKLTVSTEPSNLPSSMPSSRPSMQPSSQPSAAPTKQPSSQPSALPTAQPSSSPSSQPVGAPSSQPSLQPSSQPSTQPTSIPSQQPSASPSSFPSSCPSAQPSASPSRHPSSQPNSQPSAQPSSSPSAQPSLQPTTQPSRVPSTQPSTRPSACPTGQPSLQPFAYPSAQPTDSPSSQPTLHPTSQPAAKPSSQPTFSPTAQPSNQPTQQPTTQPSLQPSNSPTNQPTSQPSAQPTLQPSAQPSCQPSVQPSSVPSLHPTTQPTFQPSGQPSMQPNAQPSASPTSLPSSIPTTQPSAQPSSHPSVQPSVQPTSHPSFQPTSQPSSQPSLQPTVQPTSQPTGQPSCQPLSRPSAQPSAQPSSQPSVQPTSRPSSMPSVQPSSSPTSQPFAFPTASPVRDTNNKFPSSSASISLNKPTSIAGDKFQVVLPYQRASLAAGDGFSNVTLESQQSTIGSFVVYGSRGGVSVNATSDLNGMNGAAVNSFAGFDRSSRAVSVAGDVNNDGFEDLIIGVPYSSTAYVMYGTAQGFVNMKTGFVIHGTSSSDQLGWAVSGAGDVNGDGIADIIAGAPGAKCGKTYSVGAAYVVFGGHKVIEDVHLDSVNRSRAVSICCSGMSDYCGASVSGGGDVNGDGYADVIVGGLSASTSYGGVAVLVYGGAALQSVMRSNALSASQGIRMTGPTLSWTGSSVAIVGDVNHDGLDDIAVGSVPWRGNFVTQVSYLLYGNASGIHTTTLAAIPPSAGVAISGGGVIVKGVGDVNRDGVEDFAMVCFSAFVGSGLLFTWDDVAQPTLRPSATPTMKPTAVPSSGRPTTPAPTHVPFLTPTAIPTRPTIAPTEQPTAPTVLPTEVPTSPSLAPSFTPTAPTCAPSESPTTAPTQTLHPTTAPSNYPTEAPTTHPSLLPSIAPTTLPTLQPSAIPSTPPTTGPTRAPTAAKGTRRPSFMPTAQVIIANDTLVVAGGGDVFREEVIKTYVLDSPVAITISGQSSSAVFQIQPNIAVEYTINTFHNDSDVIDLTAFEDLHFFHELNITAGSVILTLPGAQVVHILGYSPADLNETNFRFRPVLIDLPPGAGSDPTVPMVVISCVGAVAMAFIWVRWKQLETYIKDPRKRHDAAIEKSHLWVPIVLRLEQEEGESAASAGGSSTSSYETASYLREDGSSHATPTSSRSDHAEEERDAWGQQRHHHYLYDAYYRDRERRSYDNDADWDHWRGEQRWGQEEEEDGWGRDRYHRRWTAGYDWQQHEGDVYEEGSSNDDVHYDERDYCNEEPQLQQEQEFQEDEGLVEDMDLEAEAEQQIAAAMEAARRYIPYAYTAHGWSNHGYR